MASVRTEGKSKKKKIKWKILHNCGDTTTEAKLHNNFIKKEK